MKKSVLLIVAVFFAFLANAQVRQGALSIGGSLEYSSNSRKEHNGSSTVDRGTSSNFTFGPRIGYFLTDGISVGAAVLLESSSRPQVLGNGTIIEHKESVFYVNPYARFHKSLGEKFFLFAEGMVHIGSGNSKTIIGNTTEHGDKVSVMGLSVSPGLIYFPAERVGLELSFNGLGFYNITNKDYENSNIKTVNSRFNLGSDTFAPRLGVQLYF